MQKIFLKILAIGLLTNLAAYGQSLGEIARENREKQEASEASGVKPKVITNKDLPTPAEAPLTESAPRMGSGPMASNRANDYRSNDFRSNDYRSMEQRQAGDRAGEQWRRQIEMQEGRVANLQARLDHINSMRGAGGSGQYGQPHGRYGAAAQERVAELQQQLDEQRRRLEQMQEAARHAGMHTSVYDP
jgi:hypothetical protein